MPGGVFFLFFLLQIIFRTQFHVRKVKTSRCKYSSGTIGLHWRKTYLLSAFFFASIIFIARTFSGSPNRVMNPDASW